jgi:prevent-host-death family protein
MSEMAIREAAGHLEEVARQAASGQVVYLTKHGQRLAAIVSADLAAEFERDEEQRVRQRLADAGLLAEVAPLDHEGPSEEAFHAARARAGKGRPLSDYVSDGR